MTAWEKLVEKGEAELVAGKLYLAAPLRTFIGRRVGEQMVLTPDGEAFFKAKAQAKVEAATSPAKGRGRGRGAAATAIAEPAAAEPEGKQLTLAINDGVQSAISCNGADDEVDPFAEDEEIEDQHSDA